MAGLTVVVYVIIQFMDAKLVQKERPDMKAIVKRSLMVFSSVIAGVALYDQFTPLMGQISEIGEQVGGTASTTAQVFTGKPTF
tara:strand:+ start:159 stop:407 length:249 start_codon:yes stop_codon:yes gene_type:complete